MFFFGFDAAWLNTPFWRTRFLIKGQDELNHIRNAGFKECWVHPSQGMDRKLTRPAAPVTPCAQAASTRRGEIRLRRTPFAEAKLLVDETKEVTASVFRQIRLGRTINMGICRSLVDEVTTSVLYSPAILTSVLRLKSADEYVYAHSLSVSALMVALGRTLGLDEAACKQAGLAGYFHDVGKAFIPKEILNKPGRLTPSEYGVVKRHALLGHRYLSHNPGVPSYVVNVALNHHEKIDGSGYPFGKRGLDIDVYSRMAAICDVYDALTSERPYKRAWDPAAALSHMASWEGHFDEFLMRAFVKTIGIYPNGSVVKLRSGRHAQVIEQNPGNLLKPVVRILPCAIGVQEGEDGLLSLNLNAPGVDDEITERAHEYASPSGCPNYRQGLNA